VGRRRTRILRCLARRRRVQALLAHFGCHHEDGLYRRLCFVSVEHTITTPRGIAVRERQDIVYRDLGSPQPARPAKPAPPPPVAKHRESHMADPVLLFRYSALTFNGHRIHYDRDYVTKVEGYPGLVFHGPLQAA
jgi:Uncharacterized conserved protein